MRDMAFIILGLSMYYHFLKFPSINMHNIIALVALFCVYIVISSTMQYFRRLRDEEELRKKNQNQENESK